MLLLLFTVCVLNACAHGDSTSFVKTLDSYQSTPKFITVFLDSVNRGTLRIAEKGQRWNAGCVQHNGELNCQFITATLTDKKYSLTFWSGGIALTKKRIVIDLKDEKVLHYSLENVN